MITFNHLLEIEGIDPGVVKLARHQDNRLAPGRLHEAWQAGDGSFQAYQSVQSTKRFDVGGLLASFVVTGARKTVFVGLYRVDGVTLAPPGMADRLTGEDVSGFHLYDLRPDDRLADYVDKLAIEWGPGALARVQKAAGQPKTIIEIAPQDEPRFPGFRQFVRPIDDIPSLPVSWQDVLRSVKGVYLLVDVESGAQYVGSAKGADGLLGRWSEYANGGDGGNVALRAAGPRPYQVSVLEVVGVDTPDERIEQIESWWKDKLLTRRFGLNEG